MLKSMIAGPDRDILARELSYHEKLYSGFAQRHFARPAVRALRAHMVQRILDVTGANRNSRVLSIGCGIGDTELLLAPRVGSLTGVDLSPSAIRQANQDAQRLGIGNAQFVEGTPDAARGPFDAVIAIFLLHHLSPDALKQFPAQLVDLLTPGGVFYSLDPSEHRASGAVGRIVVPKLMKKYQSPDEHELSPIATHNLFLPHFRDTEAAMYDFGSSPVAGLFPGWAWGYRASRRIDDALLRLPFLRHYGSNFEIIARKPAAV